MSCVLPDLLNRQKQAKFAYNMDRWTQWAGFFMKRFGMLRTFGSATSRILACSIALFKHEDQQSLRQALVFRPLINLSLTPIMKKILSQNVLNSYAEPKHTKRVYEQSLNNYHTDNSSYLRGIISPHQPTQGVFLKKGGPTPDIVATTTGKQIENLFSMERRHVHKVLKHTQRVDQFIHKIRKHTLSLDCQQIVRRIFTKNNRSESIYRGLPARQFKKTSSIVALERGMAETVSRGRQQSPTVDMGKTSSNEKMTDINIGNLTDQVIRQIDQKMVAYNERMGKIF